MVTDKVRSIIDGKTIDLEDRLGNDSDLSPEVLDLIHKLTNVADSNAQLLSRALTPILNDYERLKQENEQRKGDYKALEDNYHGLEKKHEALKTENQALKRKALEDELTGAYNRRFFNSRIKHQIKRAKRNSQKFGFSLIMYDLDHFKQVNDTYGHLAGDCLLQETTKTVKSLLRGGDTLFRYGGEEFIIIAPQTSLKQAQILAERLRRGIAETDFAYEDQHLPLTISLGIGEYQPNETRKRLISRIDDALYQAKNEGRNRIVTSE